MERIEIFLVDATMVAYKRIAEDYMDALTGLRVLKQGKLNDSEKINKAALLLIDSLDCFVSSVKPSEGFDEEDAQSLADFKEELNEMKLMFL